MDGSGEGETGGSRRRDSDGGDGFPPRLSLRRSRARRDPLPPLLLLPAPAEASSPPGPPDSGVLTKGPYTRPARRALRYRQLDGSRFASLCAPPPRARHEV